MYKQKHKENAFPLCHTNRPTVVFRFPKSGLTHKWQVTNRQLIAKLQLPLQWRHNERDGSHITNVSIVRSTVCSAQIKENIKAPRHWRLRGESIGDFMYIAPNTGYIYSFVYWSLPKNKLKYESIYECPPKRPNLNDFLFLFLKQIIHDSTTGY